MDNTKKIAELEKRIKLLEDRRVVQQDITPQAVKGRHIGEGPWFVRAGLAADIPSTVPTGTDSRAIYFATDTNKLYIHNGTAWVSATLS